MSKQIDETFFRDHVRRLFIKPTDHIGRMLHAAVGVAGEAGELLDCIKKTWIYNKPFDEQNLLEECGDLLFYLTALLDERGFTLGDAANFNHLKLIVRYPDGYTDQAAQDRADKQDENKS